MQAFYGEGALTAFCREAPPGKITDVTILANVLNGYIEFTEHQRTVFCVFSGEGVNRLRKYLNDTPPIYESESTMYDDRDPDGEMDAERQVAGLMHATGINDDDEDMDEVEAGEGSQYGGDGEG